MDPQSPPGAARHRALVIDDDELVRTTIASILASVGYDVIEASDGQQGLQLFHRHAVDLVITDILMPSKEGIETIVEIRQRNREVRIIAISGGGNFGTGSVLHAARRLGADEVLSKPFSKEELLAKVSN
jgi:CheY-like chemotaxis protein